MIPWKKAAVSLAAISMVVSPVVASAAPRALSVIDDQNDLEGASWIAIVLGLAIIAGGVWLAVDGDDDPVSP
ncbi:hypothetical protein GGC65_003110 [Sphingopyxis sp. OAS728]|uniref:hypothetical protein n=1 Tax=Sphingopyxis sp. OAS728 TaxID=2663823 RepID=UPI001788FCD1|nr:hypothetical protein [Sphingopyxis sp. OAS728]MBE1528654.1 hypothetical protein [Sphingopyxis sp. OAS728]